MNILMDPIFAAGFHPLCPYHWVKYGAIGIVTLLSIFAVLGIRNRYAQAAITAGLIAIGTSPQWYPLLSKKIAEPSPIKETRVAEKANNPEGDTASDAGSAITRNRSQHLLFALGSSCKEAAFCYIVDLNTKETSIIEAPIELIHAESLHLHWDPERELIFALADTNTGAIDLYQIDPENLSFTFITTLMHGAKLGCSTLTDNALFASNSGTGQQKVAEFDLNAELSILHEIGSERAKFMRSHVLRCTDGGNYGEATETKLPEHWKLTSKPAKGIQTSGSYASIFDLEQESHTIIWINGDMPVEPLMETIFPIHAMGLVTIEPKE